MTTLGLRMPDVLKDRLDSAATLTRRTKSQIALMAIMEDWVADQMDKLAQKGLGGINPPATTTAPAK